MPQLSASPEQYKSDFCLEECEGPENWSHRSGFWGGALHNRREGRGSLETEQRTGRRRLRSPAPPREPRPRDTPSRSPPPSCPPRLLQLRQAHRWRHGGPPSCGGGQASSRPAPSNEHNTSLQQRCRAPGLSTPVRPPIPQNIPVALVSPWAAAGDPEAGPWSSRGTPPPRFWSVTTKSRAAREAHSPCRPRLANRRGGGVRTRLRGRGPAASAVPRDPHPTSPAAARPHNPGRILLLSGAQRPPRTAASSRLRRSLPSWANPLFLFSVWDAPKGRGAWLRAEGSSRFLNGAGKESLLPASVPGLS